MKYLLILMLVLISCKKKPDESASENGSADAAIGDLSESDTDFIDTADAVRPDDEDVDEVNPVNQCGFDVDDSETLFFDQTMIYSYSQKFEGGLAEIFIDIDVEVRLGSSQVKSFFDLNLDVTGSRATDLATGTPIADTQIVTNGAQDDINTDFNGRVDSDSFPLRSNFDPEWKDILCTLPGAEYLISELGAYTTEVKFEPGYPSAISPSADPERYEEEIGDFRSFTQIKATVIKTNKPNLIEGKTYIGSVLVEKIEPKLYLPDGNTIESDLAYRSTYRFGTEEETRGLGMLIWTEAYISHEDKEYAAFKANMGSQSQINYFLPK